jgi:hypothetical protein
MERGEVTRGVGEYHSSGSKLERGGGVFAHVSLL